jgi:hypothetical protein
MQVDLPELKSKREATTYTVHIDSQGFFALFQRDRDGTKGQLSHKVEDLMGVRSCEYGGELIGFNVYFTVEDAYDTPDLHWEVHNLIQEHLA